MGFASWCAHGILHQVETIEKSDGVLVRQNAPRHYEDSNDNERRPQLNSFQVIGLSGKTGVGKTTVSLMLLSLLPGYHRVSFEDMIKQAVSGHFFLRLEELYGDQDALVEINEDRTRAGMPGAMTVRQLVCWYGTDMVRRRNSNFWVMGMDKCLKLTASKGVPGIIIDDVSFPNEANLVKRWRGLLIRMEPYPRFMPSSGMAQHASESALDGYRGFDEVFRPEYGEAALQEVAGIIKKRVEAKNTP